MDNLSETPDLGFGDFAALYRRAIQRSGLTQADIARKIGYTNQGFVSLMLTRNPKGNVPPERLAEWLKAIPLSDDEYAKMYALGLAEFAPDYVREILSNFAQFHKMAMKNDGRTLPTFEQVLAGKIRHPA